MKRCIGRRILCMGWLFVLIFVLPAFAEMKKIDDKELAGTNAPMTKAASHKTTPIKTAVDNTLLISSRPVSVVGDGFVLNLTANPETWTYSLSTFNPSYWGGHVTGARTSR